MRISPVTQPYAADVQAAFARLPADWGPPFALFTALARDPDLLQRFLRGSVGYRPDSRLTLRQREVLLLRVCANCGCRYEWGLRVHFFSRQAGITPDQVRASVHGTADHAAWTADDRLLLRLADALQDDCDIGDALWAELRTAFSDEAILELLLLAGYYRTVAYLANGLRLPPEPALCHPWPELAA
ncbi:carboxymuconolactone decarboxylase family protein [Ferrovibrio terrae]|uniref:Carboxymuconolactone decarboxylase family protein n=1 Tax=Ferrovibrio terrae TaxID=2594003 RepID=A0A516GWZ5_9PROT|nr:carboxymuconolactone decarboxylase family protein [Ferrovibrio terrae]QDO96056.1 carboxymuconolactone decarboxylase family protein [Ferrovibrio terrae]